MIQKLIQVSSGQIILSQLFQFCTITIVLYFDQSIFLHMKVSERLLQHYSLNVYLCVRQLHFRMKNKDPGISNRGFRRIGRGRCEAQSQTVELHRRLIRRRETETERERMSGKRGRDYEAPRRLLSPLLACLSMKIS